MILTREGKEIVAIYKQNGDEVDEVKDANGRLVYTNTREITGTLPLSFTSRGKPLTDYLISGNTLQDGTPTPDAPVDVVGCGVKTGNLFDKNTVKKGYYINDTNGNMEYIGSSDLNASDYIYIGRASNVYIENQTANRWGAFYDGAKVFVSGFIGYGNIVIPHDAVYVRITVLSKNLDSMMLNLGSTALPYEPYGYKLPLTINGTEYPIYLGEVPTTRRIKKLVLTGEEVFLKNAPENPNNYLYYKVGYFANKYCFCTHLVNMGTLSTGTVGVFNANDVLYFNFGAEIMNAQPSGNTAAGLKEYLAAQYAAGTPVTIWYVLANPKTAVVNEPLMKIGNYADTITMAQAGVTIPTVSGTNVLDTTTPVKPSEVYIKGKGIKSIT